MNTKITLICRDLNSVERVDQWEIGSGLGIMNVGSGIGRGPRGLGP